MVDLPFGAVLLAENREVKLEAKKSSARVVKVSKPTVDAIKKYQQENNRTDSDIMFPRGSGHDPANKWVQRVQKYYRKLGIQLQTHNIRKTAITEFYNESKDIVATQKYVGHSNIKITQLYVAKRPEEITSTVEKLYADREASQTTLPPAYQINRKSGTKLKHPAPT